MACSEMASRKERRESRRCHRKKFSRIIYEVPRASRTTICVLWFEQRDHTARLIPREIYKPSDLSRHSTMGDTSVTRVSGAVGAESEKT